MIGCPSPTHTYVPARLAALRRSLINRLIYKHQLCIFTFLNCSILWRMPPIPPQKHYHLRKWQYLKKVGKTSSSSVIILPSVKLWSERQGKHLPLQQKTEVKLQCLKTKFTCRAHYWTTTTAATWPESTKPDALPSVQAEQSQRGNFSWSSTGSRVNAIALLLSLAAFPSQALILPFYSYQPYRLCHIPLNFGCSLALNSL